jgi:hypothetical protein
MQVVVILSVALVRLAHNQIFQYYVFFFFVQFGDIVSRVADPNMFANMRAYFKRNLFGNS